MNLLKYSLLFILSVTFSTSITAQNDCKVFFPFEKGVELTYSHYNKKGKLESKTTQIVEELEQVDSQTTKAKIKVITQDKKGEEISETSFEALCTNNTLKIDFSSIIAPEMQASMKDMEISLSGDSFELPANLKAGQNLPDIQAQIQAGMNGMTIINMTVAQFNRKVEAKETITTDAGDFECYKLSFDSTVKMLLSQTYHTISWYNKEVGLVKEELYNKRGKIQSSQELTEVKGL